MRKLRKNRQQEVLYEQKVLLENWEKYRGNIVMVLGDKIFSTKQGNKVPQLIDKIEQEFHRRPLITYVPKEGTLILLT